MQSELLNCPFCGSHDLVTEQLEGTIRYPAHRVRCDHCGASSRYSDRNDWWAAWNTRASDAERREPDANENPYSRARLNSENTKLRAEITRLTEALRAAEEREKALPDYRGAGRFNQAQAIDACLRALAGAKP